MSEPEKTHIVVILLAVFGGFVFLGCIALAGLSFYVVDASDDSAMAPVPQMVAPSNPSGKPLPPILIRTLTKEEDGRFLLTLDDSIGQLDKLDQYELEATILGSSDFEIKQLKRDPKNQSSQAVTTSFKITPKNGATIFSLKLQRYAKSKTSDKKLTSVTTIDLTNLTVPKKQKKEASKTKKPQGR